MANYTWRHTYGMTTIRSDVYGTVPAVPFKQYRCKCGVEQDVPGPHRWAGFEKVEQMSSGELVRVPECDGPWTRL